MAKRLKIEGRVKDLLTKVLREEPKDDLFAVYETIAVDTFPIHKPGSLFHGAVISNSMLSEAADKVNEHNFAPLQLMHNMSDLPTGRVFFSEVHSKNHPQLGISFNELRSLFYLPLNDAKATELANKIDAGVINDVSVQFMSREARCSECGFDYFAPETDEIHLWMQECDEGHKIGEDGVHLNLIGCRDFAEISLVNNGASPNAVIQHSEDSRISNHGGLSIAASVNMDNRRIQLFDNDSHEGNKMKKLKRKQLSLIKAMNTKNLAKLNLSAEAVSRIELVNAKFDVEEMDADKVEDLQVQYKDTVTAEQKAAADAAAEAEKTDPAKADPAKVDPAKNEGGDPANPDDDKDNGGDPVGEEEGDKAELSNIEEMIELRADLKVAQRDLVAANTKITELQTQLATAQKDATDKVKFEQANAKLSNHLSEEYKTLAIKLGQAKPEVSTDDPDKLISLVKETRTKFEKTYPVGGVSEDPKEKGSTNSSINAYKTKS